MIRQLKEIKPSDVINNFLKRDYATALRAGLELRKTTVNFVIDMLLIIISQRLEQQNIVDAIVNEASNGCKSDDWLRYLLFITLGYRELVEPDQFESGMARCQYAYFAGERLLTIGDRELAEIFFLVCMKQEQEGPECYLAGKQWQALRNNLQEPPRSQIADKIALWKSNATSQLAVGDLDKAILTSEVLVDFVYFFGMKNEYKWVEILARLYDNQGHHADARKLVERQLALELIPTLERIELYCVLGESYTHEETWPLARTSYEKAFEIASTSKDFERHQAISLNGLGLTYLRVGEMERAKIALNDALDIQRNLFGDSHSEIAVTLHNLAEAFIDTDPEVAENTYQEAVAIFQRIEEPDHQKLALCLFCLGSLQFNRRKLQKAVDSLEAGLDVVASVPIGQREKIESRLTHTLELVHLALAEKRDNITDTFELNWWNQNKGQQNSPLRVQFHSSVEMIELLQKNITKNLSEVVHQHSGLTRLVVIHHTNNQVDHIGVEIAENSLIVPLMKGVSQALRERHVDPVSVRGNDRLVEMLLRLPQFMQPAEDGSIPPLPQAPSPRIVDENPDILLSDDELNDLLCSHIFVNSVIELLDNFHNSNNMIETITLNPAFVYGQDPHVHALYRALVRHWSRSFHVPEHLIRLARFIMGRDWTQEGEKWLRSLRANFDVSPCLEPSHKDGFIIAHVRERRAIMLLAEAPLLALGNLLSSDSKQFQEHIKIIPTAGKSYPSTISTSNPAFVRLSEMVFHALGYAKHSLSVPDPGKQEITVYETGHVHTVISGDPPFNSEVLEILQEVDAKRGNDLRRSVHAN